MLKIERCSLGDRKRCAKAVPDWLHGKIQGHICASLQGCTAGTSALKTAESTRKLLVSYVGKNGRIR